MALIIGSAAIAVTPDFRGFLTDAAAKTKAALSSIDASVPVKFEVDAGSVARARASLGPLAAGKTVPIRFDVDAASAARAQAALGPLAGKTVPIRFDVDKASLARAQAMARDAIGLMPDGHIPLDFSLSASSLAKAMAQFRSATGLLEGGKLPLSVDFSYPSLVRAQAAFRSITGMTHGGTIPLNVELNQASLARAIAQFRTAVGFTHIGTLLLSPEGTTGDVGALSAVAAAEKAAADQARVLAEADAVLAAGSRVLSDSLGAEARALALNSAATKLLTSDTRDAGTAATRSAVGYRGLWNAFGLLGQRVSLFGGGGKEGALGAVFNTGGILASVSAVHLLVDAIAETLAVVIPASVALGAFGVAAKPVIGQITATWNRLNVVAEAFNKLMPTMTGGFARMVEAVRPQVYSIFGDALDIATRKGGLFLTLATGAGKALDQLAARFTLATTNTHQLSQFLSQAVPDLAKLGDIAGNLGGAFGALLKEFPGYAAILLNLADAGSKAVEWLARTAAPVVGFGLAAHGAFLYGGLLATGLLKLGTSVIPRVALGAISLGTKFGIMGEGAIGAAQKLGATDHQLQQLAVNLGGAIGPNGFTKLGTDAEEAGTKTGFLGTALGVLTKIPVWGWVAVGAAALGGLIYWMASTRTATQQWVSSLQANIDKQTTFNGVVQATESAVIQVNSRLAETPKYITASTATFGRFTTNLGQLTQKYQDLQSGATKYGDEQRLEQSRLAQLTTVFGSASVALGIFNKLGIQANSIEKDTVAEWKNAVQQAQGYLRAITLLAGYQGGRALAAQRAMSQAVSEQTTAVTQVTQAEDAFFARMIGGEQAFTTFVTDLRQTAKDATAGKPSVQALAQAHASLASAESQVASAQSSLSSLQKSGTASSAQLTAAQARLSSANANLAVVQGKVRTATHGTAVSLGGLNNASLKFANDFWGTLLPAAQKQIDTLNAQFIGTKQLTTVTATLAKEMLPFAKGNEAAKIAIVGLINNALGPGTVSLKNLDKWVRQNSTTMRGFKSIVDQSEVASSQLSKTLQQDLNVAFHQDLLASSGADKALKTYTADLTHNRQETAAGRSDRARLIKDLEDAGLSAKQAANYVNGLTTQLGRLPKSEHPKIIMTGSGKWSISGGMASLQGASGHAVQGATGLYVTQGTTPTADDVITRVSKGELIVPTKYVNAGLVDHLRGMIPGFATGGIVPSYQGNVPGLGPWSVNNLNATVGLMASAMASAMKSAIATAIKTATAAATFSGGLGPASLRYLENLWMAAGGPGGGTAHVAAAIAEAESGGNAGARNPSGASGLWQILGQVVPGNIFNPMVNAENAVKKYRDAGGFSPWVTYTDGAYLHYMDQGGWLPPGLSMVANLTGQHELVLNASQARQIGGGGHWARMEALLAQMIPLLAASTADRTGRAVGDALNGATRIAAQRGRYSAR